MNSQEFVQIAYYVSIGFLVAAFITNLVFVMLPLLSKLKVPNGLGKLRFMIFSRVIIGQILIAIAIFCLTGRNIFSDPVVWRYLIGTAVFSLSIGFFIKVIHDVVIVRQQFTPEHIRKAIRIQQEINREKLLQRS